MKRRSSGRTETLGCLVPVADDFLISDNVLMNKLIWFPCRYGENIKVYWKRGLVVDTSIVSDHVLVLAFDEEHNYNQLDIYLIRTGHVVHSVNQTRPPSLHNALSGVLAESEARYGSVGFNSWRWRCSPKTSEILHYIPSNPHVFRDMHDAVMLANMLIERRFAQRTGPLYKMVTSRILLSVEDIERANKIVLRQEQLNKLFKMARKARRTLSLLATKHSFPKHVALVVVGVRGSQIGSIVRHLAISLCEDPHSIYRSRCYAVVKLMTLLTQTSLGMPLVGFRFQLTFPGTVTYAEHCFVSAWCESLGSRVKREKGDAVVDILFREWACCRYRPEQDPPLIYKIICMAIYSKDQNPMVCIQSHHIERDAQRALSILFPSTNAQKESRIYCAMYHEMVQLFFTCDFPHHVVRSILHLIFTVTFMGNMYFTREKERKQKSTGADALFRGFSLAHFFRKMTHYLQLTTNMNTLSTVLASHVSFLPLITCGIYDALIRFVIHQINRQQRRTMTQDVDDICCVNLVHGLEDTILDKNEARHVHRTLNDYLNRCSQDLLHSFYDFDILPPDELENEKTLSTFVRDHSKVYQAETLVLKCLRTSHMRALTREAQLYASIRWPLSRRDLRLLHKRHDKALQSALGGMMASLRRRTGSMPTRTMVRVHAQRAVFQVHHYTTTSTYTAQQFYEHNRALCLPSLLVALFQQSAMRFLRTVIYPLAQESQRQLRSTVYLRNATALNKCLFTSHLRFYVVGVCLRSHMLGLNVRGLSEHQRDKALQTSALVTTRFHATHHLCQQLLYYRIPECQSGSRYVSLRYMDFVQTFGGLLSLYSGATSKEPLLLGDPVATTKRILRVMGVSFFPHRYYPKTFLLERSVVGFLLKCHKDLVHIVLPATRVIQRSARTWIQRLHRVQSRNAVIALQSHLRRLSAQLSYEAVHHYPMKTIFVGFLVLVSYLMSQHHVERTPRRRLQIKKTQLLTSMDKMATQCAIRIQCWWRMVLALRATQKRREALCRQLAARTIQAVCRRYLAHHALEERIVEERRCWAATTIQRHVRWWIQHTAFFRFIQLRVAIVPIKRITSRLRGVQHRLHMLTLLKTTHKQRSILRASFKWNVTATMIQKVWRGHFVRTQYHALRATAQACQLVGLTSLYTSRYVKLRRAALLLQRWWRAYQQLKPFHDQFLPQHNVHDPRRHRDAASLHVSSRYQNAAIQQNHFLQQEKISFRRLYLPLLLYQAVFFSGPLHIHCQRTAFFVPLCFRPKQVSRSVYPSTWAWTFLRILDYCSLQSWNNKCHISREIKRMSWKVIDIRCAQRLSHSHYGEHTCVEERATLSLLMEMPSLVSVQAVSIGGQHTLLLISHYEPNDGASPFKKRSVDLTLTFRVFSWGWNDRGQLGNPSCTPCGTRNTLRTSCFAPLNFVDVQYTTTTSSDTGRPIHTITHALNYSTSIRLIGTGDDFSIAVTDEGLVFTWGDNTFGQCAHGPKYQFISEPAVVQQLRTVHISSIAVGASHVLCLSAKGVPYMWGRYSDVHLSVLELRNHVYTPLCIPFHTWYPGACLQVCCGRGFNMLLVKHTTSYVLAWGRNDVGQLGITNKTNTSNADQTPQPSLGVLHHVTCVDPTKNPNLPLHITSLCCGSNFVAACITPSNGMFFLWGAFVIFDVPSQEQSELTSRYSPWVNMNKTLSSKSASTYDPFKFTKTCSLSEPTPVVSDIWSNAAVTKVICGHTSCITLSLDTKEVYGFSFAQPLWIKRPPEEQCYASTSYTGFSTTKRSGGLNTPFNKEDEDEKKKRKAKYSVHAMSGTFRLIPALYQFRNWRSSFFQSKNLFSTFNSRGMQFDFSLAVRTPNQETKRTTNRQVLVSRTTDQNKFTFPVKVTKNLTGMPHNTATAIPTTTRPRRFSYLARTTQEEDAVSNPPPPPVTVAQQGAAQPHDVHRDVQPLLEHPPSHTTTPCQPDSVVPITPLALCTKTMVQQGIGIGEIFLGPFSTR